MKCKQAADQRLAAIQLAKDLTPDYMEEWLLDGKRHRTDGPAYTDPDGSVEWWLFGKLHRADGPAVIIPEVCSSCYWRQDKKQWWLNGTSHTESEHKRLAESISANTDIPNGVEQYGTLEEILEEIDRQYKASEQSRDIFSVDER